MFINSNVLFFPKGKEEFPTLLHFAARYGLEKLCWQLLECPGGETACQIRNGNNQTPAEIAERSGHSNLAHALQGYLVHGFLCIIFKSYLAIGIKQSTGC